MKPARRFVGSLFAVLMSAAVMAQAPQDEIDAHVAAARAAAGLDFRNTFVNLCPIGAAPRPLAGPARRPPVSPPAAVGLAGRRQRPIAPRGPRRH